MPTIGSVEVGLGGHRHPESETNPTSMMSARRQITFLCDIIIVIRQSVFNTFCHYEENDNPISDMMKTNRDCAASFGTMQKNGLPEVGGGGIIMDDFEKEKKATKTV